LNESEPYNLGMAESVEAEAIGTPGKRTFNIAATSARGSAVVWLEKEQLLRVAVAIKQFLTADAVAAEPARHAPESGSVRSVQAEFKAGEMSLRHDTSTGILTLVAVPIESAEERGADESPEPVRAVQFSFSAPVAGTLADRALEVCAAGRKPCPFCGGPIDPDGHFCVKANGHRRLGLFAE